MNTDRNANKIGT